MSESEVNIWSKVDVWVLLLTICPPSCDFVSDMPCGTTRNKTINALLFDLTISDQKYRWLRELFRETNKHPEDWNHPPRLLDQYHFIPVGRLCNSDLTRRLYRVHQWMKVIDRDKQCLHHHYLQSNQVKRPPQESINEFIIQKLNPLVVVDFRLISALLHV